MDILPRLKAVHRSGDGWTARCPAHDDKLNSLSLSHRDGRWLLRCHAGCGWEDVVAALGLKPADLFDDHVDRGGRGSSIPPDNTATVQRSEKPGLTLEQYAAEKRLPLEFLRECGLFD